MWWSVGARWLRGGAALAVGTAGSGGPRGVRRDVLGDARVDAQLVLVALGVEAQVLARRGLDVDVARDVGGALLQLEGHGRAPRDLEQLLELADEDKVAGHVPYLDGVVDAQPWRGGRGHDELAAGGPHAHGGVGGVEARDGLELVVAVQDLDGTLQIAEAAHEDVVAGGREQHRVLGLLGHLVDEVAAEVEERNGRGHVTRDDTELARGGRPGEVVHGPVGERNADAVAAEGPVDALEREQVQRVLTVVGLVLGVEVGDGETQDAVTLRVPLELAGVRLEEQFRGDLLGDLALEDGPDGQLRGLAGLLGHECADGGVLGGGHEVRGELAVLVRGVLVRGQGGEGLGEVEHGRAGVQLHDAQLLGELLHGKVVQLGVLQRPVALGLVLVLEHGGDARGVDLAVQEPHLDVLVLGISCRWTLPGVEEVAGGRELDVVDVHERCLEEQRLEVGTAEHLDVLLGGQREEAAAGGDHGADDLHVLGRVVALVELRVALEQLDVLVGFEEELGGHWERNKSRGGRENRIKRRN